MAKKLRTCRRCGETKPGSEFYGKRIHFHKTKSTCRKCRLKYIAAWQRANPDRVLLAKEKNRRQFGSAYNARRFYGIQLDEYFRMVAASKGLCALCGKPEKAKSAKGKIRSLCVDHDHSTKKIRGLLCAACNYALGAVHDDINLLRKMVAYLRKHSR